MTGAHATPYIPTYSLLLGVLFVFVDVVIKVPHMTAYIR